MTNYTVALYPGGGSGLFCYLFAANPPVVPAAQIGRFDVTPPLPDFDTAANVEAYGAMLNTALRTNPAIGAALQQICDVPFVYNSCATLLFELSATDADTYRWEAIHAPASGFAAIARNCRVARIKRVQLPPVELPETLRVMAIISAAARPGADEFDALVQAIEAGRRGGGRIEATILVGEEALLGRAAGADWLTVARLPAESTDFEAVIRNYAPHVLHVFCHGRVGGGGPDALEFATVNDWAIEAPMGSALVGIDRLGAALANGATWLVVLNCCDGGAARAGAQSMAAGLVSGRACAASAGMVAPIDTGEATLFTSAFYTELFANVLRALADPPPSGAIDFTPAIGAAHQRFHARCLGAMAAAPDSFGRWAMPILYLAGETLPFYNPRPKPVRRATKRSRTTGRRAAAPSAAVAPPAMDQARRDRLAVYARVLRSLPADTPAEVRARILALCDVEPAIPPAFRPNLFGGFTSPDPAVPA